MKIADILTKEHIITDLNSCDKKGVLDELSTFLKDKGEISNKENLLAALIEREKLGSTGIGENVAIPHAKISEIDKIITVFARSQNGVEFESFHCMYYRVFSPIRHDFAGIPPYLII